MLFLHFFVIFGVLGRPGGFLGPAWKKVSKKTSKDQFGQPIWRGYFGQCLVKNLIFLVNDKKSRDELGSKGQSEIKRYPQEEFTKKILNL